MPEDSFQWDTPWRPHLRRCTGRSMMMLALLLGIAVAPAQQLHADNFIDLSAGINSSNNVTRAFLDSDRYQDESLHVDLAAGRFLQWLPGRSVTAFVSMAGSRFNNLSGLDSQSVGLGGTYQHKLGLGAYAPLLGARLHWVRTDSSGRTRARQVSELELSYSRRLSPAWTLLAGAAFESSEGIHDGRRHAIPGNARNDIFDFDQVSLFAAVDYTFVNGTTLALNYSWIDGSTVSSALAPNPRLLGIARALTFDPAVQPPHGRHQVAYTLASRTHLLALDWSVPISRDASLNLGYARQEIGARDGVSYGNDQFSVTFMVAL